MGVSEKDEKEEKTVEKIRLHEESWAGSNSRFKEQKDVARIYRKPEKKIPEMYVYREEEGFCSIGSDRGRRQVTKIRNPDTKPRKRSDFLDSL